MNEVRVLKDLNHPGVVQSKDVFKDRENLYIIMELMEGGDLFDRIVSKHKTGYPTDLARLLMKQVGPA